MLKVEIFSYFNAFPGCKKLRPGFVTDSGTWCLTHTKPSANYLVIPATAVQSKHFVCREDWVYLTKALPTAHRFNNVCGGYISLTEQQILFLNISTSQLMQKKNFFLLTLTTQFLASMPKEALGVSADGIAPELYAIAGKVYRGETLTEEESAVVASEKWPGIVSGFQKAELEDWKASTDFPFTNREAVVADADLDGTLEAIIMVGAGNPTVQDSEAHTAAAILAETFGPLVNPEAYATPANPADVVDAIQPAPVPDAPATPEPEGAEPAAEEVAKEETSTLPATPAPQVLPTVAVGQFGLAADQMKGMHTSLKTARQQLAAAVDAVDKQLDALTATALDSMANAAKALDARTGEVEDIASEEVTTEVTA